MSTTTKKKKMLSAEGATIGALLLSIAWVVPAAITSASTTSAIPAAFAQDAPPMVDLSASPTAGTPPLTVTFTAVARGGVAPYEFRWDFGDGSTSTQGATVQHTYQQASTTPYHAAVTVTDVNGRTDSDSVDITVAPIGPPPADNCLGATITGTSSADNLVGTQGADIISGLGGNDNIAGLGGNDKICGGDGSDTIAGGAANDQMFGEAGDDSIAGGTGNADIANGGDGTDTCSAETRTACEP